MHGEIKMNRKTEIKMQEDWLKTHKVTVLKPQKYSDSKITAKHKEKNYVPSIKNICDFEDCPWYDSKSISAKEFKCSICKIKFDF